jgi:hypothetical protein
MEGVAVGVSASTPAAVQSAPDGEAVHLAPAAEAAAHHVAVGRVLKKVRTPQKSKTQARQMKVASAALIDDVRGDVQPSAAASAAGGGGLTSPAFAGGLSAVPIEQQQQEQQMLGYMDTGAPLVSDVPPAIMVRQYSSSTRDQSTLQSVHQLRAQPHLQQLQHQQQQQQGGEEAEVGLMVVAAAAAGGGQLVGEHEGKRDVVKDAAAARTDQGWMLQEQMQQDHQQQQQQEEVGGLEKVLGDAVLQSAAVPMEAVQPPPPLQQRDEEGTVAAMQLDRYNSLSSFAAAAGGRPTILQLQEANDDVLQQQQQQQQRAMNSVHSMDLARMGSLDLFMAEVNQQQQQQQQLQPVRSTGAMHAGVTGASPGDTGVTQVTPVTGSVAAGFKGVRCPCGVSQRVPDGRRPLVFCTNPDCKEKGLGQHLDCILGAGDAAGGAADVGAIPGKSSTGVAPINEETSY